jgi:hypothetical protein
VPEGRNGKVNRIGRLPEERCGGYAEIIRAAKERHVSLSGACETSTAV